MVRYDMYMGKFKGKYAISDFYGMQVLTCPNGIIGRSLSNPKYLTVSLTNIRTPDIVSKVYTALGNGFDILFDDYTVCVLSFPESQIDKVAKVLKISKRGISSTVDFEKSCA